MALDTNVLAYAEGVGDAVCCEQARQWVERLENHDVILTAQTLGELARVLTSKAGRAADQVRQDVLSWADSFEIADSTWSAFEAALDLIVDHRQPIWDALILAVAAEAPCRVLLSEDFQHGLTWRGMTALNPFIEPHPLLASLLG